MKTSIMSYVAASALALAAFRSAAGLLDNAWIKGTTDKDPLTYRAGEEIAITLTPMDIDGEVPAGEYALELTRSDDYGNFKTWTERIPTACSTNITRAGLGDYCCPPMGLAKLWNSIPGSNKSIVWVQGSEHGYVPPQYEGRDFKKGIGK